LDKEKAGRRRVDGILASEREAHGIQTKDLQHELHKLQTELSAEQSKYSGTSVIFLIYCVELSSKFEELSKDKRAITEQLNKEWLENQKMMAQIQKFQSGYEVTDIKLC
jgi:hypothetical protein